MSGLDAHLRRRLGDLVLDLELAADPGDVVAILGPNGAGKTTALRCLAGLLALDAGHVRLGGDTLDDPAGDVFVPPERRAVAVVFQDHRLFPHLSALDNVAFGLRARGTRAREARAHATHWLSRVGLAAHAANRPAALSGGQSQRVALARALATEPRLLLLDEPLAALDAQTRTEVRRDLRNHLRISGAVNLVVTHDPVDAFALADRVVVVEHGQLTQHGPIDQLAAHPRSGYVAELVGTNLLHGEATDGTITLASGARIVTGHHPAGSRVNGPAFAVIAPRSVALYRTPPDGSPRNVWATTVADIDRHVDRVRIRLTGSIELVAEITAAALVELDVHPGDTVHATVKATDVTAYPA